ncbi:hypothetical protein ACFO4E_03730 [Nocardiopsis mangrovi]|uniref:Uncharacterized protein n=1 Tax=Nocardiopsis mangrovi TaxID=1179818 RepID=A0ABV9DRE9_9ACTN
MGLGILLILFGIGCFAYAFKDELAEFLADDGPLSLLVHALAGAAIGGLATMGVITFLETPEGQEFLAALAELVEIVFTVVIYIVVAGVVIGILIAINDDGSSPPRRGGSEGTGYYRRSSDDGGWAGDGGDGGDGGGGDGGG